MPAGKGRALLHARSGWAGKEVMVWKANSTEQDLGGGALHSRM
jgi:hypothetical protein